jgi:crotonobetainyl-CoA:carnitine CoA-transferase CaiB-like acyl-CoA transferase
MSAPGPLDGVLVLAIEQAVAAPLATCRLGDAGARVIKVERETGDFARGYDTAANGESSYFVWLNRGKESLVADFKNPEDQALLLRILERADVFVQNLSPGAAQRSGLGSEELRRRFPRLITCDISGYGPEGPLRERRAYDLLVQAESGLASITGTPDGPGRVGVSACDIATGMSAHAAILEALIERATTGKSRGIHVSLFSSMAEWMSVPLLGWDYSRLDWPRLGLAHPTIAPYGVFDLADADSILIAIQNDAEFQRLAIVAFERPDLAEDPLFSTNPQRVENRPQLEAELQAILGKWDRQLATERLDRARVAYGFVNSLDELSRHPQLRRVRVSTPSGPIEMPAKAAIVAGREPLEAAVPALGEHSDRLRNEFEAPARASRSS